MKIEILTDEMIENAVTIEGDAVIFTCDRDHCTPEERAVIEAGLRYRQAETAHWIESEVGSNPLRAIASPSRPTHPRERGRGRSESGEGN